MLGESMLTGVAIGVYIALPIIILWATIPAICERDIIGILVAAFEWFLFITMTLYLLGV